MCKFTPLKYFCPLYSNHKNIQAYKFDFRRSRILRQYYCMPARLSHSYSLLKPVNQMKYHSLGTFVWPPINIALDTPFADRGDLGVGTPIHNLHCTLRPNWCATHSDPTQKVTRCHVTGPCLLWAPCWKIILAPLSTLPSFLQVEFMGQDHRDQMLVSNQLCLVLQPPSFSSYSSPVEHICIL